MLRRKPAKRIGSQHASSGRSGSLGRSLGQVVVVSQQRQREATTTWHILCVHHTPPTPPLSLPPASSGSFQVYLLATCPFCQQRLCLPASCHTPDHYLLMSLLWMAVAMPGFSLAWFERDHYALFCDHSTGEQQLALRIKDRIIASMCHQKEI